MSSLKDYGRYSTIGIELAVWVLLGTFGGKWLDGHFHTGGGFVLGGIAFGVFAAGYSLWKAAKVMQRDLERLESRETERPRRRPSGDDAP